MVMRLSGARLILRFLLLAFVACVSISPVSGQTLGDAIVSGRPLIDARLRYEHLEQDDKAKDAEALTIRARLGYQTGSFRGFTGLFEFDFLGHVGQRRFSDTIHMLPDYPAIP